MRELPEEIKVKNAFLFGSHAKGTATPNSDIDLALVIQDMGDFFETQIKLMKIRRKIDLRIEPHPIDIKDFEKLNPLALEIEKTGVEIISRMLNLDAR